MDLRMTFNMDPLAYDRYRPTYTAALFDDVIRFSGLDRHGRALEIGIGTGQATLPFLRTGCALTAVEIGDALAQFSREKFAEYPRFNVINQDFERASLEENAYDLIYSASAFHWIPVEIGLPKVSKLLKSGAAFAWFANRQEPAPECMHIHEAFTRLYAGYPEWFGPHDLPDPAERQRRNEESLNKRSALLAQYGFVDVQHSSYHGSRTYSAKEYAALISTYSDHKAMPDAVRAPFLREIMAIIDGNGGQFTLSDTMILNMGRKEAGK